MFNNWSSYIYTLTKLAAYYSSTLCSDLLCILKCHFLKFGEGYQIFFFSTGHDFEDTTIPYLFQMMITQDKLLKSMAALQMRWAERNFSTLELYHDLLLDYSPQTNKNNEFVFYPQQSWLASIAISDPRAYQTSLHCLTPHPMYYSVAGRNNLSSAMGIMRTLVHLCDFLFPLFGATSGGLDKVTLQMPAVYRVDHFLKTRCVCVCVCCVCVCVCVELS